MISVVQSRLVRLGHLLGKHLRDRKRYKYPGDDGCPAEQEAMNDLSRQDHWEKVYTTRGENQVSWFQETPAPSLELIGLVGAIRSSAIIDIGRGAGFRAIAPWRQGEPGEMDCGRRNRLGAGAGL